MRIDRPEGCVIGRAYSVAPAHICGCRFPIITQYRCGDVTGAPPEAEKEPISRFRVDHTSSYTPLLSSYVQWAAEGKGRIHNRLRQLSLLSSRCAKNVQAYDIDLIEICPAKPNAQTSHTPVLC